MQFWYFDASPDGLLPIERANLHIIAQDPIPIFELQDYPMYTLAFEIHQTDAQTASLAVSRFTDYLLLHSIPHSLLLNGELLFLIPRKAVSPMLPFAAIPGFPEVSGEVILLREQDFQSVTGDEIAESWKRLGLSRGAFEDFWEEVLEGAGSISEQN